MMKTLLEISDETIGNAPVHVENYRARESARAVLFDPCGKIALLHVSNRGYHKLPGGGVEAGENYEKALLREIREEVGVAAASRGIAVGRIVEWRGQFALHQVSYCYLADVTGAAGPLQREADEIEKGQLPFWVTLQEAIDIIRADRPADYEGRFIVMRDLAFLEEAQKITSGKQKP